MNFGKEVEKGILKILKNSNRPVSTREICLKINKAWHSVNIRCVKLQYQDKIIGFKVGKMNLWQLGGAKNKKRQ